MPTRVRSPYYIASLAEAVVHPYVRIESFGGGLGGDDSQPLSDALTDGRVVALSGGMTYHLQNVTVPADCACPGIISIGGEATIVPLAGHTEADVFLVVAKPDDFLIDGIFFDMPVSTNPNVAPAFGRAVLFDPDGGTGTNYRVENCRFSGARNACFFGDTIRNSRFCGNYVTGTWGDGFDLQSGDNIQVNGNIFEDGGYAAPPNDPAGAIRVGYSAQLTSSRNITIDGNQISRYCKLSHQSAIDCFSGSGRNFSICSNVIEDCGGTIELKTANWPIAGSPDVYRSHLIANNLIRISTDDAQGGGGGISLFYGEEVTAASKAGRTLVTGNLITGVGLPSGVVGIVGVTVLGWDDVVISGNHIMNVTNGVVFGPAGETDNTAYRLVISDNTIESVGSTINSSGYGTFNGLAIMNNHMRAMGNGNAVTIDMGPSGTLNDAEISGNYIEATTAGALDLRGLNGGRVIRNTIKAAGNAVVFQGTVSQGVVVEANSITATTGDAVSVGTGCTGIAVRQNTATVGLARRAVAGTGAWLAAGNVRGMAAANPTGTAAGALGDIFLDSTAATAGWRCTVAGGIGATYTVI